MADAKLWERGFELTKYEIEKMSTRYHILRDVIARGGEGAKDVVRDSVGVYLKNNPEASRATIMVKYGIARAFREGDQESLDVLGKLYSMAGREDLFVSPYPTDLINDAPGFFKASGLVPRAAMIRMIGAGPVLTAASYHFVPGGVWPSDLVEAARTVELGIYYELARFKVFESDASTFQNHGMLFSLAAVVSASFALLRAEISGCQNTFVGWDAFMLLNHNLSKFTLYDAWKAFLMNGWTPFPACDLPCEQHFTLCKQYFETFMDKKFGMEARQARSNAVYKCVFSYASGVEAQSLYSSLRWTASPDHLKATLTMMATWMKERDRIAMQPAYMALGSEAFRFSDVAESALADQEFANSFLASDQDEYLEENDDDDVEIIANMFAMYEAPSSPRAASLPEGAAPVFGTTQHKTARV